MCKYVIVDLEMCNVPSSERREWLNCNNEIIQIGAVLLDKEYKPCDTFMTYVQPEFGVLDSVITNLTGITNVDVFGAPRIAEALKKFIAWLPKDARLVSWSQNDEIQVRKETDSKNIRISGLKKLLDEWVDCQKTFGEIMCTSRNYGLVDALNVSSIEYDENIHDALVDAKNTALLFEKMEREKNTEFKLSPYISIGKGESFCYTPFADLLKDFYLEGA